MARLRHMGNKKWRIAIELGRDPRTGKRKRKYKTFHGTKKEAEIEKLRMIKKYSEGPINLGRDITLKELFANWLKDKKANVSPTTYKLYELIVKKHILPEMNNLLVKKLEKHPYLIKKYIENKRENGKLNQKGGLSEQSLRHHYNVLNNALEMARGLGYIITNPCQNKAITKPVPNNKPAYPLKEKEIKDFLNIFVDHILYDLIFLDLHTGLRRGEISALKWKNIDLKNKKLYVMKSAYRASNSGVKLKEPKTKSSKRAIDIGDQAINLLNNLKSNIEKENIEEDFVFTMPDNSIVSPDYITKKFIQFTKNTDFSDHSFHDIRHTHASLLLKKGAPMKAVQERLGHSSIQTTIDIYSHLVPTIQKEAAHMLDDIHF